MLFRQVSLLLFHAFEPDDERESRCIGYLTHPFEKWIAFCCKCARSDLFTPEEMQFKQRKELRTTFPVSANNDKEARH